MLLELNQNYGAIKPVTDGIDYRGYVSRYSHTLVRKRVVVHFRQKLAEFKQKLVVEVNTQLIIYNYDYELLAKLRAVIASYLGHFAKADSYRLQHKILERNNWLNEYFKIIDLTVATAETKPKRKDNQGLVYFSMKPKYQPPRLWKSIIDQYGYYRHYYPASVILFQVGSYYEFYHQLSDELLKLLRLTPLTNNKRNSRYGFPVRKEDYYKQLLLKNGYSVLVVRETGNSYCRIKERVSVRHYVI